MAVRTVRPGPRRTARRLALAAFLVYAATGGGRIVGSDEVTMYEVSRALLAGRVAVPEGATLRGADGRHYSKNAAAQAVLALPLVAVGEAVAAAAPLPAERRTLVARFVASFFNAAVSAALLGAFYALARALGAGPGPALAAALMLGFATPLWPYAKSWMAEPLQALGLLLALGGAALAWRPAPGAPRLAGLGALIAVSAKLSMLPLAVACLVPLAGRPWREWRWPLGGLALAGAGHLAYNVARFGTPLETGYGAQAGPGAWSTPLAVGVYGLLLSSGKGVAWFAPPVWLAVAGWTRLRRASGGERSPLAQARRRAALGIAAAWAVALALFGTFEHWAGDGSFGPRYLLPVLPAALLAVAFALEGAPRARRRLAWALAVAGALVQVGGVFIYFGAQMREAGDYPYTLPLGHPRFMSDSHFNPAFSPIAGHWRMLARNAAEHLAGRVPRLAGGGAPDPRLGVGEADQRALLGGLDVWWLYAVYAGVPPAAPAAALAALLALAAWAAARARAAWRAEGAA
uniref:Glycosyltransferase RgtA/B/C/D-like domain-containing protein n=1 Tax=Eiseniibacteriota bacterium TaxID=2212470 RepID=A0A832I7U3_UNCEI